MMSDTELLQLLDLDEKSGPPDISKLTAKERKTVTRRICKACRARGMPVSNIKLFNK